MKSKLLVSLIVLSSLALTSCSDLPPGAVRPLVAAATGAAIQYAKVTPAKRGEIARTTVAVGNLYDRFSAGHVPTPAQFHLAMEDYLPDNPSKPVVEIGLDALYSTWYPRFSNKIPQIQFDYLTNFLLGAKDGALPFVAGP